MSHWRDLLMLNKLHAPVGNMRIFIRIRVHILHVVQSADPQFADQIRIIPVARGRTRWVTRVREIHRWVYIYIYGECAHEQHVSRTVTLTLTHMITAYSVTGNVVRVRTLICVFLYGFFPVINGRRDQRPKWMQLDSLVAWLPFTLRDYEVPF